jgi:hypothetical protein
MIELKRPEVTSGFIAHPEGLDQFHLKVHHVSKGIDPRRNPTSYNRVSNIIAHRQHVIPS